MKAIRLEQPGRFAQVNVEPVFAALQPDEALVRVHRIGVCGTDIHAFRGDQPFFTYPRILGHELGVEVLELGGQADRIRAGQHCAVEPYGYFEVLSAERLLRGRGRRRVRGRGACRSDHDSGLTGWKRKP